MYKISSVVSSITTKYHQIADAIIQDIESGKLAKGEKLPSVNMLSTSLKVSRDTIEKAYKLLKERQYIVAISSKGYYASGRNKQTIKILLVVNKLSFYKKMVYENLLAQLDKKATIDLCIHHYRLDLFKKIMEQKNGHYHYYLVMPHFENGTNKNECVNALKTIQESQLILLDKDVPELGKNRRGVVQNFTEDIYNALSENHELINKYKNIVLVMNQPNHHPKDIGLGIAKYCLENKKSIKLISDINNAVLRKKTLYIFTFESDLAIMIKKVRQSHLQLGEDVGILSFNETVFKELLGISVASTDFKIMGEFAADIILNRASGIIHNPFKFIDRGSI